jgi:hypothetical protein
LVTLEDRLPLGDALLGPVLGLSLLKPNLPVWDSGLTTEEVGALSAPAAWLSTPTVVAPQIEGDFALGAVIFSSPSLSEATAHGNPDLQANTTFGAANDLRWNGSNDPFGDPLQNPWGEDAGIRWHGPLAMASGFKAVLGAGEALASGSGSQRFSSDTALPTAAKTVPQEAAAFNQPALAASVQPVKSSASSSQTTAADALGRLPLDFEANEGQTDPQVRFLTHGLGYTLYLTATEAVMVFPKPPVPAVPGALPVSPKIPGLLATRTAAPEASVVRIQMVGANPDATVVGEQELPGKSNYLIGRDSSKWVTDVPHFGQVVYHDVYPGVDLVYYGNPQQQLEYDWVVAPGADPGVIRLNYQGAAGLSLDPSGNLIVQTGAGDLVQHIPALYQEGTGGRQAVAGHFVFQGGQQVVFEVGNYDASRPLIIDPLVSYSTFLGGSSYDAAYGIAVDAAGNAYVTGFTSSSDFPTANPIKGTLGGAAENVFVTKFSPGGSALLYSTYLGGSYYDEGEGIALDSAGDAYVAGSTESADFPVQNALYDHFQGFSDAFVTELNTAGDGLVYSTYLGGDGYNDGFGIAVDGHSAAYVTGATDASDFPHTLGSHQGNTSTGFVTEFSPGGSSLVYSRFLGGSVNDQGNGIAVDSSGNAYVTGSTASTDFPTQNPLYSSLAGQTHFKTSGNMGLQRELLAVRSPFIQVVFRTFQGDFKGSKRENCGKTALFGPSSVQ